MKMYLIHPVANIFKNLINVYENDSSWYIEKRFRCHYVKTVYSFYEYVFDFIISDDYFMENGLIKQYATLSPAELCSYRVEDSDPYYVVESDELNVLC